jgi:hypothetical protein
MLIRAALIACVSTIAAFESDDGPTESTSIAEVQARSDAPADCGLIALYFLLQLESHNVNIDVLQNNLPTTTAKGYSLRELSSASERLGLRLNGLEWNAKHPPTRAAIAWMKPETAGHFVLIRPVGVTGAMVQIIDPPAAPRILDFQTLARSPEWTGRLLVPDEGLSPRRILIFTAWLLAIAIPATLFRSHLIRAASRVFERLRQTPNQPNELAPPENPDSARSAP